MVTPFWYPFALWYPLRGSCNEVVWQQSLSGIFLIQHWRPAWLSSYRKCINHLKLVKSNLHLLGKECEYYSLYIKLPRNTLFLFPVLGNDILRDSEASEFSAEWKTCWVLGWFYVCFLPSRGWCEVAAKKTTWCFLSIYHVAGIVLSSLYAPPHWIHSATCITIHML